MFINRKILKWGGIFLLVALVIFGVYSILEWKTYEQEVSSLSPEEMAERVIRENVKEEFLPKDDNYIHKTVSYAEIISKYQQGELKNFILPPFGSKIANLYLTDWVYENVYFNSYIAYDKETGNFIGYDISIQVKEPKLKGIELAQKYLRDIPKDSFFNKWSHGVYVNKELYAGKETEISSIVYKKGLNKVYIDIKESNYPDPVSVDWPDRDTVRKIGVIWMEVFTSSNPNYSGVEQLQKDVMAGYEEE